MAVFKSKKIYIKRYASKNADKKVTFAPAVKAGFNGGSVKDKTAVLKQHNFQDLDFKHDVMTAGGAAKGNIRFGLPDEKYQKMFTDEKPVYTKGEVVSGPGSVRPAPIEKPDLSNVAADAHVRPIVDGKAVGNVVWTEADSGLSKHIDETPLASADNAEGANKTDIKVATTDTVPVYKPVKDSGDGSAVPNITFAGNKPQKTAIKSPKTVSKPRRERKTINAGKFVSVFARVALLVVLVGAVGVVGYKYISQYSSEKLALNEKLNTNYLPEDYMYPVVPDDIAQVNAEARQRAEAEARANAYVPARSEVPGLFQYDYVKSCYLTFDDGPSGPVTESILDTLKQYNVPATFFVVGKNAEAYPDLLRRIEAEGHSIGNHSYSHDYDYMYSGDPGFDDELHSCRNTINRILGKDYNNMLYRFPGGSFEVYKQFYIYNIEALGYQHVDWNSLTGDSETEAPDEEYIMNTLKETTNNGTKEDIVLLMHDAGAKQITADTLPMVIEYLKSKNYVFKAVYNSKYVQE